MQSRGHSHTETSVSQSHADVDIEPNTVRDSFITASRNQPHLTATDRWPADHLPDSRQLQLQHTVSAHLSSRPTRSHTVNPLLSFHSPSLLPRLPSFRRPASSSLPLPPANRTSGQLFPAVRDRSDRGKVAVFSHVTTVNISIHAGDTTPLCSQQNRAEPLFGLYCSQKAVL